MNREIFRQKSLFRSVRVNFQYAIDILCGSLNRDCDIDKLFKYIGLKNTQSPIKIEFVFVNGTFYDPELKKYFEPAPLRVFSCDEPVVLPHYSAEKCNCMDCSSMCPISNKTVSRQVFKENLTKIDQVLFGFGQLHLATKVSATIYFVFVVLFVFANIFVLLCHSNNKNAKSNQRSRKRKQMCENKAKTFFSLQRSKRIRKVRSETRKIILSIGSARKSINS